MDKQAQLNEIAEKIAKCKICKKDKIGKPVPGEGYPDAKVMFIGEAPGRKEAETGRPFIGRSGQLLRRLIRESGLKEEEVYITSPVKYLPKRGTPTQIDIEHGREHLFRQVEVINPKIMVLLGNTACKAILEKTIPILKAHGSIIEKNGKKYIITLHPAAVIRFPKYTAIIKSDFAKLKGII